MTVSCDLEHLHVLVEQLTDSSQWQAAFSIEREPLTWATATASDIVLSKIIHLQASC